MIKYLLFVCLITTPFAQTPEAVVTHYDLEGNLIQEDNSLQASEDIDSMNSMIMNQQDIQSNTMDSIGTDSMDYSTPEQESNESSNLEAPINQEQTEIDSMNVDSNQMNTEDSMMMNENLENSMPEQDSMYSINDPNDINAVEPSQQMVEETLATENTEVSNLADVNSEVINEIQTTNLISESNEVNNVDPNYIDPNNLQIPQDNQIDVQNILDSNVGFTTENNVSNNFSSNEVDPNMAFQALTNTDNLQSSTDMENGFAQSEISVEKAKAKETPEPKNDENHDQGQGQGQGEGEEKPVDEQKEKKEGSEEGHKDATEGHEHKDATEEHKDATEDHKDATEGHATEGHATEEQKDATEGHEHKDATEGHATEEHKDATEGHEHKDATEEHKDAAGEHKDATEEHGQATGEGDGHQHNEQHEEKHEGDKKELQNDLKEVESTTNKQLVQGNCIIIYSQCNFKGEALEACNSLSEIEEFKAQIRSIYIPDGLGLTVYDGENFTGNLHKFKSSQECLTTPLSFAQLTNSGNQLRGQNLRFRL